MSYNESYRQAPKPEPDLSRDLDRFERSLRELQVEYEKFFAGALALPPEDAQQSLRVEIRRLRNLTQLSSAEVFRLGGLEARFNSYGELFNRRLRDHEEGRVRRGGAKVENVPDLDAKTGIVVSQKLEGDAVEALFVGLSRGKAAPKLELETFRAYLQRNLESIRQKTGCAEVQFRIEEQDGKVRLKARPVKSS